MDCQHGCWLTRLLADTTAGSTIVCWHGCWFTWRLADTVVGSHGYLQERLLTPYCCFLTRLLGSHDSLLTRLRVHTRLLRHTDNCCHGCWLTRLFADNAEGYHSCLLTRLLARTIACSHGCWLTRLLADMAAGSHCGLPARLLAHTVAC